MRGFSVILNIKVFIICRLHFLLFIVTVIVMIIEYNCWCHCKFFIFNYISPFIFLHLWVIHFSQPRLVHSNVGSPMSNKNHHTILADDYTWTFQLVTVYSLIVYSVPCFVSVIIGPELFAKGSSDPLRACKRSR